MVAGVAFNQDHQLGQPVLLLARPGLRGRSVRGGALGATGLASSASRSCSASSSPVGRGGGGRRSLTAAADKLADGRADAD